MSTKISMVATAAIAHPLAIHHSEVRSSSPQSSVGLNMSAFIPARYLDNLLAALPEGLTPGRKRVEAPLAVADQLQVTAVELLHGAAMAHADQNRFGEL